MRYHAFRLQIVPGPEGGYRTQVFSPRGEGWAPFAVPFGPDELVALKVALAHAIGPGRHLLLDEPEAPEVALEALGERLFAALFQGEVLRLYERSLDLLGADPESGLRIELMLDPRDAGLAALQALPWELMRQPGTPEFLALSRRRPFVRSLAVPRAIYTPREVSALRLLAVACNPRDENLDPLDLARELRNLGEAVGSTPHLEMVRPAAPTFAALRQACIEHECQVLHFMGHGGSVPGRAEGVLFFEADDGSADPVRGADLVNKLADFPTLRLVVLNACESAAPPGTLWLDPLASVASSLVLGGMPAVVAMQLPISDPAAITFSRVFYRRLAAGDPVDAAVAEGRQAVHSADPAGIEWATPVLFLRGQDAPPERPAVRGWARRLAAAALGLLLVTGLGFVARAWWIDKLVDQGVDFFDHERWSEARERFQTALNLAPGRAEILSNLAATEERLGQAEAAEEHYKEAVARSPDSAEHLFNLGLFLNVRGKYDEAYSVLSKAALIGPARADTYGELAHAALGLGMPGRARVALSVAVRLDPQRAALHRLLGVVELQSGNPRAALDHLTDALGCPMGDREKVETTWLLMQAHERLGEVASACGEMRKFRLLDELGITPWAPEAEAAATRLNCSPQ